MHSVSFPHPSSSMPHRPGLTRLATHDSSTSDFRGVIDDLTVANKKLKQKLRKYEKLYDAHHQDDKLFEVRFHGLPDHKKKELEETLRKFAVSLDDGSPPLETQKRMSSASRPAESGYGTMSGSGQNSASAPSNREMSKSQYNQQQRNVQSYLHDIPAGLLPQYNASMSAHTKKKLVVRRLEQVFAGKLSTPGSHQQPEQQEEVAQSAATADRHDREAAGQRFKEGIREALIMPLESNDETMTGVTPQGTAENVPPTSPGSGSPDQRPTRPLDLDPARAQVPAENMEYFRHLGFTLPGMISGEAMPNDGWIYLNLLINMAQLHTINVTPAFVRDALMEFSSKFELSQDGGKVRWKGGNELTLNSGSSSEQLSGYSPNTATVGSGSGSTPSRSKVTHGREDNESAELERQVRRATYAAKERDRNRLSYTPIFLHRQESSEEDDIYNFATSSSNNSPFIGNHRGHSSYFAGSVNQSSSSRRKRDDGPMIFYKTAPFCTDLCGDKSPELSPSSYESLIAQPLGTCPEPEPSVEYVTGIGEARGPFGNTPGALDHEEGKSLAASSDEDSGFSLPALRRHSSSESAASTIEFEASGIGGVQPDDNFSIRVHRSQTRGQRSTIARHRTKHSRLYPKKILEALNEQQSSPDQQPRTHFVINEEILSTKKKNLPSSTLPPASFLTFDTTSSGDVDSDLDSDVSSDPSTSSSSAGGGPSATPQVRYISPLPPSHYPMHDADESENDVDDDDDDDEDDSMSDGLSDSYNSNSNRFAAQDHEAPNKEFGSDTIFPDVFDIESKRRLAGDLPAGSSAATAGGGSGFNTPAQWTGGETDVERESPRGGKGLEVVSPRLVPGLKRSRTSDSAGAAGMESKRRG